jgi:hypothetical protein
MSNQSYLRIQGPGFKAAVRSKRTRNEAFSANLGYQSANLHPKSVAHPFLDVNKTTRTLLAAENPVAARKNGPSL